MLNVQIHLESALKIAGVEIFRDGGGAYFAARNMRRIAGPGSDKMAVIIGAVRVLATLVNERELT